MADKAVGPDGRRTAGTEDDKPSLETLYVGTTMALIATQRLAANLAAYLAGVPIVDGRPVEDGAATVRTLLEQMALAELDPLVTDLNDGEFDAELAKSIALDTIGAANQFIAKIAGL